MVSASWDLALEPTVSVSRRVLELAVMAMLSSCSRPHWSEASRASAGLAPNPQEVPEAVIVAYRASTWGWRGIFADHTWIAAKRTRVASYRVYEVTGWRLRSGLSAVRSEQDIPDRMWYGSRPTAVLELRGAGVEELIDKIELAVLSYPWRDQYKLFPGPNSNTFTAWIAQKVPELGLVLPWRAIGKNFVRNDLLTMAVKP